MYINRLYRHDRAASAATESAANAAAPGITALTLHLFARLKLTSHINQFLRV
jgi:hypothetical protein